jgi:hypothetical protein
MKTKRAKSPPERIWTATELRELPDAERDAILAAAAELAEEDYRDDPELTAFEAFDEDDIHDGGSSVADRG